MKIPTVSVLMPVYNGEKYLKPALKSLFNQTLKNFELIVINDGSTDKTSDILNSIKDKRLKIVNNGLNLGVAKSLNIGLGQANGKYIARCDADDICLPARLQKQVNFLNQNKLYALVGSKCELIDSQERILDEKLIKNGVNDSVITDRQIRKQLLIRNPIIHPTVLMRKQLLLKVGNYRPIFNGAEDYDLWFRLSKIGKLYNLKEQLLRKRIHKQTVTSRNHFRIELLVLIIRFLNIDFLKYLI